MSPFYVVYIGVMMGLYGFRIKSPCYGTLDLLWILPEKRTRGGLDAWMPGHKQSFQSTP